MLKIPFRAVTYRYSCSTSSCESKSRLGSFTARRALERLSGLDIDRDGHLNRVAHMNLSSTMNIVVLAGTCTPRMHSSRRNYADASILPKPFEPLGTQFRIAHGVCDVAMAEVLLDRARIVTVIGEFVARRVPQHVRVDREGEFRALAGASEQLSHRRRRQRSTELTDKQIRRARIVTAQLAQRAELGPSDRMRRRQAVLQSRDMQEASLQIHLVPAQC